MSAWKLQDAKARLSELIERAKEDGPQTITQRGVKTAVIIPFEEWERTRPRKTKLEVLLGGPKFDTPLPDRKKFRARKPPEF